MFVVQTSSLMYQNQDQGIVVASELHCMAQQLGLEVISELMNSQPCYQAGQVTSSFRFLSHLVFVL